MLGPFRELGARDATVSRTGWRLLGVPVDCSGRSRGEERGPAALREAGIAERLGAADLGDVDVYLRDARRDAATGVIGYEQLCEISRRIRDEVRAALYGGLRLLVVGGCCSLLPGVMAGVRAAAPGAGLAFVDGHLDFYDGRTSDTGEAADMDLAVLVGHGAPGLTTLGGPAPTVDPARIVVLGYRDDEERARLGAVEPADVAPAIRLVHARELADAEPATLARDVLARVAAGGRFWLHFDLDVLDEETFPAVTYPQPHGPDWDDAARLLGPLLGSPALLGVDVTDLNADRDPDGSYAREAVERLGDLIQTASR